MTTNSVAFGSLTAKTMPKVPILNFDLDNNGIINLDEFLAAVEELGYDYLNLSTIDKDKDKKVTEEEYELWTQEEEINRLYEEAKEKAATDFIGQDDEDIKKFLVALDNFKQEFFEQQKTDITNSSELAKIFAQQLSAKYMEIKNDILCNTKSAIKKRVIEKITEEANIENIQYNSNIFAKKSFYISDNTKRLLCNILTKEADKFAKKYNGNDFEADLTFYLDDFLNKSDKEKLSEAISIWEEDFSSIANLPHDIALKQMKDKVKNLILSALENGITLTMGRVTIRTEVGIIPALAQYKDIDTLLYAIIDIIKNISELSKLEQIINNANEKNVEHINFFKTSLVA